MGRWGYTYAGEGWRGRQLGEIRGVYRVGCTRMGRHMRRGRFRDGRAGVLNGEGLIGVGAGGGAPVELGRVRGGEQSEFEASGGVARHDIYSNAPARWPPGVSAARADWLF